jgi:thiosulfate/3-mercaptopyruvate sulfurtransferase
MAVQGFTAGIAVFLKMMDKSILIVAEILEKHLHDPGWVLVDCRFDLGDRDAGRRAYEAGHIPGSVYLDLDRDLAGPVGPDTGRHPLPDAGRLAARLGELGIGNDCTVVVYDDANGAIAARAWWIVRWLGHDSVRLLDGGFARWRSLGLPLESRSTRRAPRAFQVAPRPERVISTDEVAAMLGTAAELNLLDARDRERFRGNREPIDPVAGHIPGTRNLPFADFVNADGTWRSLGERKQRLLEALDGDPGADWCVMCGSGVTACHLAITGVEAGLREPRLYVGSWSEWIRDERRPVATGAN